MRLLADENVEPVTLDWRRAEGHDVWSVYGSSRGAEDSDLLIAAAADGRVVVTYDLDFGELAFRRQVPHAGIVLLRLTAAKSAERLERLKRHWPVIELRCPGHFVVVHDNRVRPLPSRR